MCRGHWAYDGSKAYDGPATYDEGPPATYDEGPTPAWGSGPRLVQVPRMPRRRSAQAQMLTPKSCAMPRRPEA